MECSDNRRCCVSTELTLNAHALRQRLLIGFHELYNLYRGFLKLPMYFFKRVNLAIDGDNIVFLGEFGYQDSRLRYSKHPHIRTNGLRTPG